MVEILIKKQRFFNPFLVTFRHKKIDVIKKNKTAKASAVAMATANLRHPGVIERRRRS